MRIMRPWILGGTLAATFLIASLQVSLAQNCSDLVRAGWFSNAVVQSAIVVPADATTGMPAYCEVTAVIAPVPGSKIAAVYRLPEDWNGRMLGLGGGGWSGNLYLSLPLTGPGRAASVGLPRGYATAQTDGGHSSTVPTDVSWVRNNPTAVTDFSHRAIHEMTVLGKQVVASHYGRPPFKAPGAAIPPELMKIVHDAVLTACDARDGLKDGVITDRVAVAGTQSRSSASLAAPVVVAWRRRRLTR